MKCPYCNGESPAGSATCIFCDRELPQPQKIENNSTVVQNITYNVNNFGTEPRTYSRSRSRKSPKSKGVAIALCCCGFIGFGGLNRFYVGKKGSGFVYLFTIGLMWIGTIIDLVKLRKGTFTDSNGMPLK